MRTWRRRAIGAQLVIDEPTSMALAQADPADALRAFWTTGISVLVWWNLGTLLGAVSGQAVGDPATLGLDVAFPAAFLALLAPQLRRRSGRAAAGVGGFTALMAMPITPPGVPVLLAGIGAAVACWVAPGDRA